ncbi:MAG: hypothetical protein LBS05_00100 [Tannerellaceae bacterium]|nr:hypothetical protein [Tannerellaceae bacterium]
MAKKTENIPFVLLDDSVVTYGFRVLVDGVDIEQFARNPVMFYLHDDYMLPIGRWANIRKEKGRLLAEADFDYEDPDPLVKRIIGKVERGFLRAASIGFASARTSEDEALMIKGQTHPTVVACRLREASIVNIGANNNALRLYDDDGKEIDLNDEVKLSDVLHPKKPNTMNDELKKLLNLSDKATDADVAAAVGKLMTDQKTLSDRLDAQQEKEKTARTTEATALLDAAVREGRLNAEGKASYLKLFAADHEGAKAALAAIPPREKITTVIEQNAAAGASTSELADLQSKSWDTLDREERLFTLRDKYPDLYKEKFKARFGVEPK